MIKNTLKQTKFEDKTVKSTQLSLVPVGLHDFQIFPDRTAHACSVGAGNICSVSVFFVLASRAGVFRGARISSLPTVKLVYKAKYVTAGIASIKLNNISADDSLRAFV